MLLLVVNFVVGLGSYSVPSSFQERGTHFIFPNSEDEAPVPT